MMIDELWTIEKSWEWYRQQPWLIGCNFIPSTAINQLEMWQANTYDPVTITRELGWAASLGFNTARVYLHDLAWLDDPEGFKKRIDHFLDITIRYKIRPIFVLFDDCWYPEPVTGKQPEPKPGVHNSGWMQGPGKKIVTDPTAWSRLADYVHDVVSRFATDERILLWDVYNEPGNSLLGERSLGLLGTAFQWVREAKPNQPVSAGVWSDLQQLNDFQLASSDIITFHNYNDVENLTSQIKDLKVIGRPLICTEYMARILGSRFTTHLPVFKQERVGCINWGLVSGKTQTIFPWGSSEGDLEPVEWFHDIFHQDGSPYSQAEVDFIREITLPGK